MHAVQVPQRRVLYLCRDIFGVDYLYTSHVQDGLLLLRFFGKLVASPHHKEMGYKDIHPPPVAIAIRQRLPSLLQEQTQLLFALFQAEKGFKAVFVGIGSEEYP